MRPLAFAATLGALALTSSPALAQGAWCSEDMNARNCGFYTLEQCKAYASGLGAMCYANPYLAKTPAESAKRSKRAPQDR